MTSTPVEDKLRPKQPLVQLVFASKQALHQGQQLCSRARSVSVQSAQTAADVLALDAKVRWITNAVTEQLKVHAHVTPVRVSLLSVCFQASCLRSKDNRVKENGFRK